MKKKIMAIAVSALMLLQGANAFAYGVYSDSVQDTELVVNGGFEKGSDGWWLAGAFSVGSTARSGSKGLQFKKTDTAYRYANAMTVIDVEKNTDYTLTYYYKQITGGHHIKVRGSDGVNIVDNTVAGTATSWKENKVTFNSGDNTDVVINIMDNSSVAPEIYFDDFTLTIDDANAVPAQKSTLINGGFELGTGAYNPTGWKTTAGWRVVRNYGWGRGNEFLRSGDTFLYHDPNNGAAYQCTTQEVVLEANKKYELSYYHNIKAQSYRLELYIDGTIKTQKDYSTTSGFQKITHTITTGSAEQTLKIAFKPLNKALQVGIDDVSLKVINPDPVKETIMNGDIEGGGMLTDSRYPIYWKSGNFPIVKTQKHGGTYSMEIPCIAPQWQNKYQTVEVEPNTDYTFEWYEMRNNGEYIVKIPNTTLVSSGKILNGNGSTSWVKQSITFNSLDSTSIDFTFTKKLATTDTDDKTKAIYIDDIKLIRNSAKVSDVKVLGYPAEGKKLFAVANVADASDTLNEVKYQWQISDDGASWTDISGATADTYVPTDLTKYYRVKANAEFAVLYNNNKDFAESSAVYSNTVSASDEESFKAELVSDIELDIFWWDRASTDKLALRDNVTVAREYGIDTLVGNIATYEKKEATLVEIKDCTLEYEGKDITITLDFAGAADATKITKENIVLTCGREAIDYEIEAVVENEKVTGAVITLKNEMTTADNYQLSVNLGKYCTLDEIYSVPKPVTIENVLLKNSSGEIVDRVSDITDGNITFTADVKNNTYAKGKAVNIITAIYNGGVLCGAKVTPQTIAKDGTYTLNAPMDVPTVGLSETWTTATYVWDDDSITPLVEKKTKSFGIDALNDPAKDITVAFIGGSITQGKNYTDPFIEKWQADRTGKITMINAGIGGTTSSYGTMRLYEDVLSKKPDIVFIEFTLNDSYLSEAQTKKNVESMIRQCYESDHQPVVSFIIIPDRRTNTDGSYSIATKAGYYTTAMEYYGLTPFNAHQLVVDAIDDGGYTWDSFVSEGNVHPDKTQGANIATVMYNDFKANYSDYVKNITWKVEKGFNADTYSQPSIVSSAKASYDSSWENSKVDDVVTEGYGVPTKLPFESFMASSKEGGKMSLKFKGTKILISSLMGKQGKGAKYVITNSDGVVEKTGDITTYISGYNWYENIILTVDGLEDTNHTLTITVGSGTGLFGIGEFWVDE